MRTIFLVLRYNLATSHGYSPSFVTLKELIGYRNILNSKDENAHSCAMIKALNPIFHLFHLPVLYMTLNSASVL